MTTTPADLRRRGLRLEYLTITWNAIEAVVAVAAGIAASSIALVGFGLDSVIEGFAASVVIWDLRGVKQEREGRALRLIAISFFALGAYVVVEALRVLVVGAQARQSEVGIVLAAVSLVAMVALAAGKRRTGQRLESPTLVADSAETRLCAYLSAILLAGLVANATFGWWWADSLAAVGIAVLALREGREAWRESSEAKESEDEG
ncbi:MAG: cation transporter [Candidatus Methylomirabilales bacterium]